MNNRRPGLPSNPRCQLPSSSAPPLPHPTPEYPSRPGNSSSLPKNLVPSIKKHKAGSASEHSGRSLPPSSFPRKEISSSSLTRFPAATQSDRYSERSNVRYQGDFVAAPLENVNDYGRRDNEVIATEKPYRGTSTPSPTPETKQLNQEAASTHASSSSLDYGYNVWNRVSDAAASLTINVSKAWASTVASASGEETPPGQDSHLTRALKAYHISKARDFSDLPEWLFTDRERRTGARSLPSDTTNNNSEPSWQVQVVSAHTNEEDAPAIQSKVDSSLRTPRLRGADRLKAIRDTRRGGQSTLSSRLDTK